ncbi:MAG: Tryptophan--tRNA ligase [Microgenomates bacterium OLB23]|nr:MAG: Tryptophan--tRNA ligase [Microgenomates bacterium OLB23]
MGAVQQWVHMQNTEDGEYIFMLVNLHSITVAQDPELLRSYNYHLAAWFLAAGLNPKKTTMFVQSQNPDHPYLAWMFDCITPMGWMERMTQYKDKSKKQGERTSVGLFHYPSLMAADILLYNTTLVPVGEDQTQHIEITRDIAEKFNNLYGEVFALPKIRLVNEGARVMSLQNPTEKMSKSSVDPMGTLNVLDTADEIQKKVMRAVTDSGTEVRAAGDKPALKNLLALYSAFSGKDVPTIEAEYVGKGYGDFKKGLAEVVIASLEPIQKNIMNS